MARIDLEISQGKTFGASEANGAGKTTTPSCSEGLLYLIEGTVKNYVSSILGKLGAANRTQAVSIARERKLL